MNQQTPYAIGTPGEAWQQAHKAQWLANQKIKRSFFDEVLTKANRLSELKTVSEALELVQYGELNYSEVISGSSNYPLLAFKSKQWDNAKKTLLVTGGVHGYETSGVHGALAFVELAHNYPQFNILVAFCVSPWGYETINRWNPQAIDPNRSFYQDSPAPESAQLMSFVKSLAITVDVHVDLHETTDTDNSEFRPALAARDGVEHTNWNIPDGFYLVGDTLKPEPAFQRHVIEHVEKVTHIAPSDDNNCLISAPLEQFGVINYATVELGLCAGFSHATYCTTTEVYPDSPLVDDKNCIDAQVAAVVGALDYVIKNNP